MNKFGNWSIVDDHFAAQEGHGTATSRTGQNETILHRLDGLEPGTAVEYDRSLSSKSGSTVSRVGKAGELLYSLVTWQGQPNQVPSEIREPSATLAERSIYDHAPEHYYANVEKDESGRLLNRDTLAFGVSDFEVAKSAAVAAPSNGPDGTLRLVETSRVDRCCEVPVVIHRSKNVGCANSCNHSSMVDRTQSDATYHIGSSTFYQRVDSTEGTLLKFWLAAWLSG